MSQISAAFNVFRNILTYILFMASMFSSICCSSDSSSGIIKNSFANLDELKKFPNKSYKEENINGTFPDAVYIKTRTQSFNSYYYFILQDGHIWYKAISSAKEPASWMLLKGTGLPYNKEKKNFVKPEEIVEIYADADELVALCNKGRFYRICFDRMITRKENTWADVQGWPFEEPLVLNNNVAENLGWAMGKRNSHVLYYEDIFGNQHHYGTMEIATTYILHKDGQEISISDTGLPTDFSHNLIGPERGKFKSVAISASASTMFLINAAGEMYTRLADFDTIGSDPMFFKYTYVPYKSDLPGTDYLSNYTLWGLPSEGWRPQSKIPLKGKAALTKRITILQNGAGNSARELRVAGLNEEGKTGYWSKLIFGDIWSFVPAALKLNKSDFLNISPSLDKKELRGPSMDKSMTGYFWKDNMIVPDWKFEAVNFNILEGSFIIKIYRKNESCSIIAYPVEVWTYYRRNRPGRDGTPKNYFLTIEIPEGAFDKISEEFRNKIETALRVEDRNLFHFTMEATAEYISITPREKEKRNFTLFLTNGVSPNVLPAFQRVWNAADMQELNLYHSAELMLPGNQEYGREQYVEIKNKIDANKELQNDIKNRIKEYSIAQRRAFRSRFAYSAFNIFTHVTLLYKVDFPKIYTLTRFGSSIMETNDVSINLISGTRIWIDQKLLEMIELRIDAYEKLTEGLEKGYNYVSLPANFSETCMGYWELAQLPKNMEGVFTLSNRKEDKITAYLKSDLLESDFPGWIINVGNEEVSFTALVELNKALGKISKRSDIPADQKPYIFQGNLFIIATSFKEKHIKIYEETSEKLYDPKGIPVNIHWDGRNFSIRKNAIIGSGQIIFQGTIDGVDKPNKKLEKVELKI